MEFLADHAALAALFVFSARVCDVSLGTLRTLMVFRGYRARSALIGFIESLIWVTAAGVVLSSLTEWYMMIAYAGGYATGNYVGIWLESKLAMGMELVRIISRQSGVSLSRALREEQFSVVEVAGRGDDGNSIEVLFVVEQRRLLPKLVARVEQLDPEAIYTISDVKVHRSSLASGVRSRSMFGMRR